MTKTQTSVPGVKDQRQHHAFNNLAFKQESGAWKVDGCTQRATFVPDDLPEKVAEETKEKLKKAFCDQLSKEEVSKKLDPLIKEEAE